MNGAWICASCQLPIRNPYDRMENALRQQVCSHTLTLEKAQTQILALKVSHGYKRGASVR